MNNDTTTTDSAAETQAAPIDLRAAALELEQLWIERERDQWPEYSASTPSMRPVTSSATRRCRLELQAYLGLLPRAVAEPNEHGLVPRPPESIPHGSDLPPTEPAPLQWLTALIDRRGPNSTFTAGREYELDPDTMYSVALTGAELAKIRGMLAT